MELKLTALFHAPQNEPWLNLNTFLNLGLITYYKTHYLHLTSASSCGLWSFSGCLELLGQRCDSFTSIIVTLREMLTQVALVTHTLKSCSVRTLHTECVCADGRQGELWVWVRSVISLFYFLCVRIMMMLIWQGSTITSTHRGPREHHVLKQCHIGQM